MAKATFRCPICGAVNPVDARRCVDCWGELATGRAGRTVGHRDRRRRAFPYAVVGLVLVAVVLAWAIVGALTPRYPRTVRAGLLDVTVTGRENRPNVPATALTRPPEEDTYQTIVLAVTVKNRGDRPRPLDPPNQMTLVDAAGQLYRALPGWREADLPDTVPPGGEVSGHVAFRVPVGTAGLRLIVAPDRVFRPGEMPIE